MGFKSFVNSISCVIVIRVGRHIFSALRLINWGGSRDVL